jgi:hypothetical protein
MAGLNKQSLPVPFGQGVQTKKDPKQLQPGAMFDLRNAIFNTEGLLQKRNGFGRLTQINDSTVNTITTFKSGLTAIGESLHSYIPEIDTWYNKGSLSPVQTQVGTLVRSSSSQSSQDVAITDEGLACAVWIDSDGTSKYQIVDTVTSQIVVSMTDLPETATVPRTFVLGRYFIVTYLVTVTAATHLQFIAIPIRMPTSPLAAQDVATTVSSLTAGYDGYVVNNGLYLAWDSSTGGGAVHVGWIDSTLLVRTPNTSDLVGYEADYVSVTADASPSSPVIWVTFWDPGDNTAYTWACASNTLVEILAPTSLGVNAALNGLTSYANDAVLTVLYQTENEYPSTVRSDYVASITCTQAGSVGTPVGVARGVGLASKAFAINDRIMFMAAYSGAYQPTNFLIDVDGVVLAKLAYSNAGGYPVNQVLPQASVNGTAAQIGYLYKATLTPVAKNQQLNTSTPGIYTQTAINLVSWDINAVPMRPVETGENLNLSGGFLWAYDGVAPVEQGFHLYPEDIETRTAIPFTGDASGSDDLITNISDMTGIEVGMKISSPDFVLNTTVLAVGPGNQIQVAATVGPYGPSARFQANSTADGPSAQQYYYAVTYEWTDAQGNLHRSAPSIPVGVTQAGGPPTANIILAVPTLRLTEKLSPNPVRVVVYRWSAAQQTYYQVSSITSPLLNDPSVDVVYFVDVYQDADILGNQILYTTGGIVENIAAPASADLTLYKDRLFLINAENRNQIWYSKQIIANSPVEMSDLFTFYVAPTSGAQGSTGPCTVLAAMDDKLIIFKADAPYYMTGDGPDNTGANNDFSTPTYIASSVGCSNPRSVILIPSGLMFQSSKGIWLLGRDLSCTYIGAPVERYNDAEVLSVVSVPSTNQVRFTLDNGVTLMYDYYYNQWGVFSNIPAISSTLYEGLHTYVDSQGRLFQETPGLYLDGSSPVLMSFTSAWFNLAGLQGLERAYFFQMLGQYITPHKLSIGIAYDYNPAIAQQTIIEPLNYTPNYGSASGPYGSESPYGGMSDVEQWRIFLNQQKVQAFRVTLDEIYDPSFGVAAGAGFTMSGLNLTVGLKKGYTTLRAAQSVG